MVLPLVVDSLAIMVPAVSNKKCDTAKDCARLVVHQVVRSYDASSTPQTDVVA